MNYSELAATRRSLESAGVPDGLAAVWFDAAQRKSDLEDQIRSVAATITSRIASTLTRLDGDFHVNDSGEIQSAGPEFDRLCALRQQACSFLMPIVHSIVRSTPEAAAILSVAVSA